MKSKGWVRVGSLVVALALLTPVAAQEPSEESADAAGDKPGFWSRFALFIETMVGSASADDISANIETTDVQISRNSIEFEELDHARLEIGWTLPEGKGAFSVVFTGFKETDYVFTGQGLRSAVADPTGFPFPSTRQAPELVKWWDIQIQNGQLASQSQQPTWIPACAPGMTTGCDVNNDGFVDLDEIEFLPSGFGTTRDVTDTLENQTQTVDVLFLRDFGGRRYSARWGVGVRYFTYEGNMPVAAWLRTNFGSSSGTHGGYQGYTDGAALRLINFSQETTAVGPSGLGEFHLNWLRERVVTYFLVRAAFVIQDAETGSDVFFTFVENSTTGNLVPVEARLFQERDKDVWHSGGEAGVRELWVRPRGYRVASRRT